VEKMKSQPPAKILKLAPPAWLAIAVALGFITFSLEAAEPLLTLAMAKVDYSDHHFQSIKERVSVNPTVSPAPRISETPTDTLKPLATEKAFLSTKLVLAKPERQSTNPFILAGKGAHAGLWAKASFQAGYGQVFFNQTEKTYCPSGTGWEEPGCGYLKVHFRL
jgi:hypothetical protein